MFQAEREYRIEWGDCDPAQIVFYPRYFALFNESTGHLLETALAMPLARVFEHYGVVGIPMVNTGAEFFSPCRYGERVSIQSSITRLGRSSFDVRHVLRNAGGESVRGHETRVWTSNRDGVLKAVPLPDEVASRLRSVPLPANV